MIDIGGLPILKKYVVNFLVCMMKPCVYEIEKMNNKKSASIEVFELCDIMVVLLPQ